MVKPRRVAARQSADALSGVIQDVHSAFLELIEVPGVEDMAFVGNTGGHYGWTPASIIDIDIAVFLVERSSLIGVALDALRCRLRTVLQARDVQFELRAVNGSYKPTPLVAERTYALAHVALFAGGEYTSAPHSMRWSWRKYRCLVQPHRLASLALRPPTIAEVRSHAAHKLERIRGGTGELGEWLIPSMQRSVLRFSADEPLFWEYCLAAAAAVARSHGRALGHPEADALGNNDYAGWYCRNVLDCAHYSKVMRLKDIVRREGYEPARLGARRLASSYLDEVISALSAAEPTR